MRNHASAVATCFLGSRCAQYFAVHAGYLEAEAREGESYSAGSQMEGFISGSTEQMGQC